MPQAAKKFRLRSARRDTNTPCKKYHNLYGLESWKQLRTSFLQNNPLCVECKREGIYKLAKIVDHIQSHKGREDLFFDVKNLQPLCKKHHDKKTYQESLNGYSKS